MKKLSQEEIGVLRCCVEESGTAEMISRKSRVDKKKVEKILKDLETLKLVKRPFKDKSDYEEFWSKTPEGERYLEENVFVNDFGDVYLFGEEEEIIKKIQRLSDKSIDTIFFKCGFVFSDRGSNKAVSNEMLKELRKDSGIVGGLLLETPKKDVLKLLKEVDKK